MSSGNGRTRFSVGAPRWIPETCDVVVCDEIGLNAGKALRIALDFCQSKLAWICIEIGLRALFGRHSYGYSQFV